MSLLRDPRRHYYPEFEYAEILLQLRTLHKSGQSSQPKFDSERAVVFFRQLPGLSQYEIFTFSLIFLMEADASVQEKVFRFLYNESDADIRAAAVRRFLVNARL